jgi:hypothetical protein
MKRVLLVSFGLILVGSYAGCLPEDPGTPTGTAGTNGTAGTGSPGAAGNPGTAGDTSTGGTTGSGGDPAGVGGTGGSIDPAGAAGTGGSGTAGATAGSGGGTAGATAGTGGGPGGRGGTGGGTAGATAGSGGSGGSGPGGRGGTGGGTAGTGGGQGGRGGTGGTGGGTGGTGGGGIPTIPELFPTSGSIGSLDGRLVTMPCGDDNVSGTDCGGGGGWYSTAGAGSPTRIQCSGGNFNLDQTFYVGGETGRMYNVTMHFYGVSEPKNYGTGVTREAGTARPAATPTGAGATPTPYASAAGGHTYPGSDYNTNELHVCRVRTSPCPSGMELAVHYLNADTSEGHWTYVLNYEKPIVVVGGGHVRVRNFDRNCREIKNCGPAGTAANQCANAANARIVNVSAAMPTPANSAASAGGLLQPNLDPARPTGSSGQWLLIDVVRINSVQ